jgi:hypothetical protein
MYIFEELHAGTGIGSHTHTQIWLLALGFKMTVSYMSNTELIKKFKKNPGQSMY